LRATAIKDFAACFCGHARTKTVAVLANKIARLESAFHCPSPDRLGPNPSGIRQGLAGHVIQEPLFTVRLGRSQFTAHAIIATFMANFADFLSV
jgi:hypothetical protein